ncbi:MAG: urea ABC transporter ATP-binding protein UrtD [Candidatus Latescibacterota bacterium]|nr:urea ABC transporter ATP-binding protein UrtD [Candidatus Latescibacterota bacterium]
MNNLYVEQLTVTFDGFKALDIDIFEVQENELRVVIGPNGAGKTTLLDVLCGKTKPDSGHAVFGPMELTRLSEDEIVAAGVGRKFQTPSVFATLSVFDNLMLALRVDRGVFTSLFHRLSGGQRQRIEAVAERTGLQDLLTETADTLSHGQKQWLEIAMVVLQEPKLFLVDEPAAGMSDEESFKTGELLQGLAVDHSLIVIEHDMKFVRQIARKVTVLHEGRVLMEGSMEEVQSDPRVIECYLGTALEREAVDIAS